MTNSPPEVAGEREAFEAWRRRTTKMDPDGAVALRGLGEDSGYDNTYTRCMHMAWMARAALSAPAVEPVAVKEATGFAGYLAGIVERAEALHSWMTGAESTPPTGVEGAPTDDDMDESGDESESDSLEDRLTMAFARLGLLRGKTLLHDSERQELTQARKAIFDALAALAAQPVAGHQGDKP